MAELERMIKELSEADGAPGAEREVRELMRAHLEPLSDEILRDRLGGIVGKKTGQADGPKILMAGHLDEVGWIVTHATEKGFLKFQQAGSWWSHVMVAQRVRIKTRTKGDVIGIIGSKAPHVMTVEERTKVIPMKDLFIDVGAKNRDEIEAMGIRPGDAITPVSDFMTMRDGELFVGKALDNRAGCAMAIEVLKQFQGEDHPNVLYSGATVQEEIGMRGAQTLAHLVQPDIAFAFDVGVSYDTPGLESTNPQCVMGEGPVLFIYDASMVPHQGLRDLVIDTAKEIGVKLQFDSLAGGGTDAGKFHMTGIGCPSLVIGFATRYIHSHTAIMSRSDFENAVKLVKAVIKKLDKTTVEELHNY